VPKAWLEQRLFCSRRSARYFALEFVAEELHTADEAKRKEARRVLGRDLKHSECEKATMGMKLDTKLDRRRTIRFGHVVDKKNVEMPGPNIGEHGRASP